MGLKLTTELKCDCCGKALKFDVKPLSLRRRRRHGPISVKRILGLYVIYRDDAKRLAVTCDPLDYEIESGEKVACSKKCTLALIESDFDKVMKDIRKQHAEEDKYNS